MQAQELPSAIDRSNETWRALRLFAGYRLFLASVFFFVFYLRLPPEFLGHKYPGFYQLVSFNYLLLAVMMLILSSRQWGQFDTQCSIQLILDVVMLALIIHTSGGLDTGLGALLVVIVVGGGAMIPGRMAAFIAAIATLAVLLEASYGQLTGQAMTHYGQAGMLGAIFFVTALLAQLVARTMQSSQTLAEQRAEELSRLATLNQHIISRMQMAVLVIDGTGSVSLLNISARELLALDSKTTPFRLDEHVPQLATQVERWQAFEQAPFQPFQAAAGLPEMMARATRLDSGEILLFLENTTELAQQAQQLKLASLGRLTASIAHEIRNPLSAINHASELLAEQSADPPVRKKLIDIIQRHSSRVNAIIETILKLSRRKQVEPELLVIAPWLEKLREEFCELNHLPAGTVELEIITPLARIWTDAQQLHQMLWNLLDNALQHADQHAGQPILIRVYTRQDTILIDVVDNGPGVSDVALKHLFEPFYSERQGGTGLGLYLARELCQANGARLDLLQEPQTCFRISYPLHKRDKLQ